MRQWINTKKQELVGELEEKVKIEYFAKKVAEKESPASGTKPEEPVEEEKKEDSPQPIEEEEKALEFPPIEEHEAL
jgi:hypothetical protein